MTLADAIQQAHEANERRLSAGIGRVRTGLDQDAEFRLRLFADWCRDQGIRHTPATPASVALYIRSLEKTGVEPAKILLTLEAIQAAHDHYGLASPVASSIVRAELDETGLDASDIAQAAIEQNPALATTFHLLGVWLRLDDDGSLNSQS